MFGNTGNQIILKFESVKEIKDNIDKTKYNHNRNFTLAALVTKKKHYFFLEQSGIYFYLEQDSHTQFQWGGFSSQINRLGGKEEFEELCWKLYDEVIDDLDIE